MQLARLVVDEMNMQSNNKNSIEKVKDFWENQPLFLGESKHLIGTKKYFEEHRAVYINDCFAGEIDNRLFPGKNDLTLDLGCGPGFWTVEFFKSGVVNIIAADLTQQAIELTQKRLAIFNCKAEVRQENAQSLSFPDSLFDHVNCQGVIHHTPDTQACIAEIARILKPNGKAVISVYYQNFILRNLKKLNWIGKLLSRFGAKLSGRGREKIFSENDVDEITRLYDGRKNPIGKSYSKKIFIQMLEPYFEIKSVFFHFFPARALPFKIPALFHKHLDTLLPFMIYAELYKK